MPGHHEAYDYLPIQNWIYVTVDSRGSSRSLWVKVADDQTATIVSRSC